MYGRIESELSRCPNENRQPSPATIARPTGDRTVPASLYEEGNRDAWIRADFEAGVTPEHRLYMICDECGGVFAQRVKPGNGTTCGDCGATFEHDEDATRSSH